MRPASVSNRAKKAEAPKGRPVHSPPASGYITQFSVAPEPATLAMVALGVAGTLLRRRGR